MRRENQQRRVREKSHSRGLSASYLEGDFDEDDENSFSLSAIKKGYKKGSGAGLGIGGRGKAMRLDYTYRMRCQHW